MTKASDNDYPSVLLTEQGSAPTTPAASHQRLYFRTSDHTLVSVNSSGTVTPVDSGAGAMATDALWDAAGDLAVGSGANTAAKLVKGAAGANLSSYNGVVAWNGGTSFPASPATGDRYWRSDLGLEAYYDGAQWLSTTLFDINPGSLIAVTVTGVQTFRIPTRTKSTYSIYVEKWIFTTFVATTNDGSNCWVTALEKLDTANSATSVVTQSTSADTVSTWTNHEVSVGVAFSPATNPALRINVTTKTGSPGSLTAAVGLVYRLILT